MFYLLILACFFLNSLASKRVEQYLAQYQYNTDAASVADFVRYYINFYHLDKVKIRMSEGRSEYFDPTTNVITIRHSIAESRSCAAVAIVAHECAHARQYANRQFLAVLRFKLAKFIEKAQAIAVILYISLMFFYNPIYVLLCVVYLFVMAVFSVITLIVEVNASYNALTFIKEHHAVMPESFGVCEKILKVAASTYLINAICNIAILLLWLL